MEIATIKPRSLVEQVCDQLAELIRRHQPGSSDSSLPAERRLAEQFGVSRQVVRESIKRLELQGLLEVRQGSGVRIVDKLHRPLNSSLSLLIPDATERLRQLQETRLAIEPDAAALAALRATAEQIQALREIHTRLETAVDNSAAIELDIEFHHALAEASGNLMFRLILDSLADISLESRKRTIGRFGKDTAIEHHGEILAAVEAHDSDRAAEAMRRHLLAASDDMDIEAPALK